MNYQEIKKLFDGAIPWRGSDDRPWDNRKHSDKRMRMRNDGSIEVDYKGQTFVTYHPNGRVTLEAYSFMTQQDVYADMMPDGVRFDIGNRIGECIATCPIGQMRHQSSWHRFPWWLSKSGAHADSPRWDDRKANPDVLVMRANKPVTLDYYAAENRYVPVDPDGLEPFEWEELDRSAALKLTREYRIPDFQNFLQARATLVGAGGLPEQEDVPRHDELLDMLKSDDFNEVLRFFPRGDAWQRANRWRHPKTGNELPDAGYLGHLRTHLYKKHDVLVGRSERILTLPEYKRVQSLLYRFKS